MVILVTGMSSESIYKEVVVIGNGPSGISLSYMLAGNLPYVISNAHPDEMLATRLKPAVGKCLIHQDLGELSLGLEGRTTNPVSLLLDALEHPCADIGLEMEPLVEWRKDGTEIDHIVLGKGPPGGSWHKMDPNILTLSLGSWMALPGLPYPYRDNAERRAFASKVARYYSDYVQKMHLAKYFQDDLIVTKVTPLQGAKQCAMKLANVSGQVETCPELARREKNSEKTCALSRAFNFISFRGRRCKRPREGVVKHDLSPDRKIREIASNENCPTSKTTFGRLCRAPSEEDVRVRLVEDTQNLDFSKSQVPCCGSNETAPTTTGDSQPPQWLVETYNPTTNKYTTYQCKYLVLANGASDSPNKLDVCKEKGAPRWLLHDVRSLEIELDRYVRAKEDDDFEPVVVVGAGLSAADAVIAARARNIPVVHVFRNKSATLNRQLPENMYPEYHKVHQMMKDGGSTYSLYRALPEYTLTNFDEAKKQITLTSPSGEELKISVSFAAVLIGSTPNFSFLPANLCLGTIKNLPIDCKTNPIDIDRLTHRVKGVENLFALGPLAGDNFVRFIPGGALAVVAEIYRYQSKSEIA